MTRFPLPPPAAARRLATDRANLYRRMRRLGLEPPRNVTG